MSCIEKKKKYLRAHLKLFKFEYKYSKEVDVCKYLHVA